MDGFTNATGTGLLSDPQGGQKANGAQAQSAKVSAIPSAFGGGGIYSLASLAIPANGFATAAGTAPTPTTVKTLPEVQVIGKRLPRVVLALPSIPVLTAILIGSALTVDDRGVQDGTRWLLGMPRPHTCNGSCTCPGISGSMCAVGGGDKTNMRLPTQPASNTVPGTPDPDDNSRSNKPKSPNQLNNEIRQGRAPSGIDRVDIGKVKGEQTHVHFFDDSALNMDGTWKHGGRTLSRDQKIWLTENGWKLPK